MGSVPKRSVKKKVVIIDWHVDSAEGEEKLCGPSL
jgi:hypothetical protein